MERSWAWGRLWAGSGIRLVVLVFWIRLVNQMNKAQGLIVYRLNFLRDLNCHFSKLSSRIKLDKF